MARLRTYLVLVCTVLAVGWSSSVVTKRIVQKGNKIRCYREMEAFCSRIEKNIPAGSVLFVGDSHVQGLCVIAVCDRGVNLGIGGDTTAGVLRRLQTYISRKSAVAVVVAVGVNDIFRNRETQILDRYRAILESVPPEIPLVLCGVFPVDPSVARRNINDRVWALNKSLEQLCSSRDNRFYYPVPARLLDESDNLASGLHIGDGVHLNPAGNRIWIAGLRARLERLNSVIRFRDHGQKTQTRGQKPSDSRQPGQLPRKVLL